MYYPMLCSMGQRAAPTAPNVPRSPGIVGFANDSFNCYANAAIQALANCPPLIQHLMEDEKREACPDKAADKLPDKFREIILDIWSEKRNSSINPEELIEALRSKTKLFQKGIQHDSQEFIHFLMLLMKEEEGKIPPKKSPKRFRRSDSGLGSLHAISQSSSVEEDEEDEEEEETDEKEDKEKERRETQHVKETDKEEVANSLERRDSGLELELTNGKQVPNNVVSIFESAIEINTRCHACNKDSCIREVSETIRVPILSTTTKVDPESKGPTPQAPAVTEQPAPVNDPGEAAIETTSQQGGSAAEEISGEGTPENLDSTVTSAEVESMTPVTEGSVKDEGSSGTQISKESEDPVRTNEVAKSEETMASIDEEKSSLMHCVKKVWRFIGLALCGSAVSSSSSAAYEQLSDGERRRRRGGQPLTLVGCIDEMFKSETMEGDNRYKCDTCKELTNASRKVKLLNLSKVLIFQLMRFTFEKGKVNKVQDNIQFPPTIDMTKYLPENENEQRSATYELVSIICHQGGSNGGHYTTFAKNDSSKLWHFFDDTRIAQVSLETVLRQQAYILFYRRL